MKNQQVFDKNIPAVSWVSGKGTGRNTIKPYFWELVQAAGVEGTVSDFENQWMPYIWNDTDLLLDELEGEAVEGGEGDAGDGDGRTLADKIEEYLMGDYNVTIEVNEAWTAMEKNFLCLEALSATLWAEGLPDVSIRQAQNMCGWNPLNNPFYEFVEWYYFDYEFGEAPVGLSAKNTNPLEVWELYGTKYFHVTDARGWMPVLEPLGAGATVELNTRVTNIAYGEEGVQVTVVNADNTTSTLGADYVISTFSVGVLQDQHSTLFSPPLTPTYQNSLFQFPMSAYLKIYIRFPTRFWGKVFLYNYADERRGYFPLWQNMEAKGYYSLVADDYHVLMATVTGEEALRLERLSDADILEEAVEVLRNMWSKVPDATGIHVHRWNSDPLFRGSKTSYPVGITTAAHVKLQTPLEGSGGRVYVSGDAMHPTLSGYVHGALEQGRQTGREVFECASRPTGVLCLCSRNMWCNTYDCPDCDPEATEQKGTVVVKKPKQKGGNGNKKSGASNVSMTVQLAISMMVTGIGLL